MYKYKKSDKGIGVSRDAFVALYCIIVYRASRFVNRFLRIFDGFVFFFRVEIYDNLYVNNYAEGNESMNKKIGMIGSLANALTVLLKC